MPIWYPPDFGGSGGGGIPTTAIYACPAVVALLDLVYFSAPDTVDQASATTPATASIGIVISKPSPLTAEVLFGPGLVSGFAGLVVGAPYYLDLALGGITSSLLGFAAGNIIQPVGTPEDANTLLYRPAPVQILL